MPGGLIQLITTGIQDSPIIGNPEITFFKTVYRQHTMFSLCQNDRYVGNLNFGKNILLSPIATCSYFTGKSVYITKYISDNSNPIVHWVFAVYLI